MEIGSGEFVGGGFGAGLDHVFSRRSKGFSAKSLGPFVISLFFMTLWCNCNSTVDNEALGPSGPLLFKKKKKRFYQMFDYINDASSTSMDAYHLLFITTVYSL
jgi:hypothetical protein